ncbi:MAG: bifunctional oligoribonuclease/PAP phosphatase NrnA [Nitrospirae bacterium]|nr:bifunctional oligoribonuclease/PAP phosphatase NrnA [Nitrospirota bacterium]
MRPGTIPEEHRADYEAVLAFLSSHRRFVIASHESPDGDALASTLAMALGLRRLGKEATAFNKDGVPATLRFLPGAETVVSRLDSFADFDGLIVVDCGDLHRIRESIVNEPRPPIVNLDHHLTNPRYGDHNLILPDASASGHVVYYVLLGLGVEVDAALATNLYTALTVDTGSFQYSNTGPETLRVAAELVERGARPEAIAEGLHYHEPVRKWRLLSRVLGSLKVELGGRVATMDLTQAMLRETGASMEDNEGFVEMARQVDGVEVAILLKEHGADRVKVSLRAKDRVDVSRVAQAFGGGGHRNASGCTIRLGLEPARGRLLEEVARALDGRKG